MIFTACRRFIEKTIISLRIVVAVLGDDGGM